jgi:eukaryotic-like serine/threonine-protein kinase
MPLAPGTRLGTCEILAPLGAGGMGEVYRARDTALGREVAVKVLPAAFASDPDRLRRFTQEAQAAAALNHPNILAIHHIGEQDGAPYIVSELLEGETLRDRLRAGALPVRKAVEYAVQTANGLASAHEKGIVHRDLKPENLFVTNDGRVKILDFGLAKLTRPDERAPAGEQATVTAGTGAGLVLGTVGYMSPEQVRAQTVDARTDIFSLGAILYEMVTGKRAFQGETPADTMSAILREEPPPLTATIVTVPPALERVVRHCLEKNPFERFQSARDLKFDLSEISSPSSGATTGITTVASTVSPPTTRSARTALLAIGALLLAAGAAAAGWWAHTPVAAEQPTFHRLTFRRGIIASARFTPDRKTIVYGASWEGNPIETFLVTTDSPESRSLGVPRSNVYAVSASNELALSLRTGDALPPSAGTLARMPALGGAAPREVMTKVEFADWGPGDTIAVTLDTGVGDRLEYPVGTPLYEAPGPVHQIRVSPDGDAVAFQEIVRGRSTLSIVDRKKQKRTVLTDLAELSGLAWTSDGGEIWFAGKTDDSGWGIYATTLSGTRRLLLRFPGPVSLEDLGSDRRVLINRFTALSGIRYLGPDAQQERDMSWLDWSTLADMSADGRVLLFSEFGEAAGSSGAVYLRKSDGTPAVRLGAGGATSLSQDGKWALTMTRSRQELRLLPTGVGEARTIKLPDGFDRFQGAQFLPDGRLLVEALERGHDPKIYVLEADGKLRAISEEGLVWPTIVSPDGMQALVTINGKTLMLDISGGAARPVPGVQAGETPVAWSADGQSALVSSDREDSATVTRVNLKTGQRTPWKVLTPADPAGLVRMFNLHFSADGKSYAYTYARQLGELYVVEGLR